jgi:uncharacterized protein (TIGR03437 family)
MTNSKPMLALVLWIASPAFAVPVVNSVVNGASFTPNMSPGCLISIFGTGFASSLASASTVPLPISLGNTSVKIGGFAAPLYFVSPDQINAQVPFEVANTINVNFQYETVPVVVTTGQESSATFTIALTGASPGLFTTASNGKGQALYVNQNFMPFSTPLIPGSTIVLYATGLAQTNPPATTGAGGLANQPLVFPPNVYIGETQAQVSYAGLAPGFVGVYQLNVVVPAQLSTNRIMVSIGGQRSNVTRTVITPGTNTMNASGTIEALYPTPPGQQPANPPLAFSPLLIAAQFTAAFTLAAGAQPFTLAAVSEAGSSIITVNPSQGILNGTATTPTPQTRAFDFSHTEVFPIDFLVGLPFPGSIIPESRLDTVALTALTAMPSENLPLPGMSTAIFQTVASVPPGGTVEINGQSNSGFASFAGWLSIPYAPYLKDRSTTLELFIDGTLVVTLELPYSTV